MIDVRMLKVIDLYSADEYFKFIGFEVKSCTSGHCLLELPVTRKVLNPVGKVHGSIINTLCSVASSIAALSIVENNKYTAASDFNISVFSNISSGIIRCEGRVLKAGKRLIFVETLVKDEVGTLIAAGRVTKAVLP